VVSAGVLVSCLYQSASSRKAISSASSDSRTRSTLVPPGPTAHDVEHSIKKAMERNAKVEAESVAVESSNGTITLRGMVSSWADHDEAVAAAWAASGVTRVEDHILIAY
jgi:osmotically-inducible protein OsmY